MGFSASHVLVVSSEDTDNSLAALSLDPATGVVTWNVKSEDPVTHDFPEDPFAGFLPPNDATQRGEGFIVEVKR